MPATFTARLHAQSSFAVASVKPTPAASIGQLKLDFCRADGSFLEVGAPVLWTLKYAFSQPDYAIAGAPAWLTDFNSAYDIEAKPDGLSNKENCRAMLQSLLVERFHLATHHEPRLRSLLFLQQGAKGAKLTHGGEIRFNHSVQVGDNGKAEWPNGWTMARLAGYLSDVTGRPVVDQTGLTGTFGITLDYSRSPGDGLPDITTALEEQLGLKLSAGKGSVDMLVIDHIQKPDPN